MEPPGPERRAANKSPETAPLPASFRSDRGFGSLPVKRFATRERVTYSKQAESAGPARVDRREAPG